VPTTPAREPPFVSVVIPVRNGSRTLAGCLDAVQACDYPPESREVLVVDNGSTDATAEIIRARAVTYLSEPRRGVSAARNRGIRAARGEIVALIDCDCMPERSWLAELVRPFEDSAVGCVAGELGHLRASSAAERQAARMLGHWQRFAASADPPYAITANAAFRRTVFDRIGLFDPRMVRAQDVELGVRFARAAELRLVYSPTAVVRHRHRSGQLGFFRQQLGWAFGSGLVGAKHRALLPRQRPPSVAELVRSASGLARVAALRARGRGRPEYLEDAWYELLRRLAWWLGSWAGLVRGRMQFG
jgi:cellulose synthase/poly-beta-1,6-N-acetylglucosamine synthase-like glycosyltransferase